MSQIPYGTIQNTSNASSHIDVLKEESDDMVRLAKDGVIENNVKTFVYCDCGVERFGHFSKCQRCLDMGSGHSGGGNF